MKKYVLEYDLPDNFKQNVNFVAIDTEAMGLNPHRDRLCVVQLKVEDKIYVIHFKKPIYNKSKNLIALLKNSKIQKIFHYARFDMFIIYKYLKIMPTSVICTRTLSKIVRTYSDRHSLKELCKEFLKKDLNKGEQSSDWGSEELSQSQIEYAAKDVIYLEEIYEPLWKMATRDNKDKFAKNIFGCIETAVMADFYHYDIGLLLAHH
jgi:ribonuclease D